MWEELGLATEWGGDRDWGGAVIWGLGVGGGMVGCREGMKVESGGASDGCGGGEVGVGCMGKKLG